MYYVYVLQNKKRNYIYVGTTGNLENRLSEHNRRKVIATRRYVPLKLVYYEAYLHKGDAIDRESKLKHHGSVIGHLKRRIRKSLLM